MSEKIVVKVNSGSSGLIALIISFFFGPIGAFFSWWLIAKWSFLKSFLYAIIFLILLVISALLIYLIYWNYLHSNRRYYYACFSL